MYSESVLKAIAARVNYALLLMDNQQTDKAQAVLTQVQKILPAPDAHNLLAAMSVADRCK
jgi:hypothetical protein